MKIRNGFVSNSSTSSFCIYGAVIKDDISEEAVESAGLEIHHYFDEDTQYIGRSWKNIKDDETGLVFKKSVEEKIAKLFGNNIKCQTYEEAWYDG